MFSNLMLVADTASATSSLKSGVSPIFSTMITMASILCVLFIVFGGIYYMTSAGNPEKLERAKKTLRNAFIGFALVLGSGALVAIMQSAYSSKPATPIQITSQQPNVEDTVGIGFVVNQAVKVFIKGVVESVGQPIISALKQFTTATPLMAQNGSVFNLWIVIVAMTDVLFLLVVGLIGFRIMGASVIGLEDVDIRSMIPQVILVFITANVSIFAIDAIITVSNAMIQALLLGLSNEIIWTSLGGLVTSAATVSIGILFFIVVAIILAVMLLVYYLKRLIILYIGAVLSPLIVMLWLVPSFKDFAISSAKIYITTIFVLFVQVTVLMLAVSLFSGVVKGEGNLFMTSLLAIATLSILLTTNRTMNQLSMMGSGSQGIRKLSNTFVRSASHIAGSIKDMPNHKSPITVTRMSPHAVSNIGNSVPAMRSSAGAMHLSDSWRQAAKPIRQCIGIKAPVERQHQFCTILAVIKAECIKRYER